MILKAQSDHRQQQLPQNYFAPPPPPQMLYPQQVTDVSYFPPPTHSYYGYPPQSSQRRFKTKKSRSRSGKKRHCSSDSSSGSSELERKPLEKPCVECHKKRHGLVDAETQGEPPVPVAHVVTQVDPHLEMEETDLNDRDVTPAGTKSAKTEILPVQDVMDEVPSGSKQVEETF